MCQVNMQQIGRVEMIEKIIKYEVKVSVPSSQASQHLKKFENVIYKAINQGQGMKQTDVVSIKGIRNGTTEQLRSNCEVPNRR